jgi:hypothetical protein
MAELVMKAHNKQQGLALLLLVFVLTLAATSYLLKSLESSSIKNERNNDTSKALIEAKSAILGWSLQQSNPGQLPCPEDISLIGTANEGRAQASCNSSSPAIGRLPWRDLGLGDIRDGNGDKLWYVMSPGYQLSPINSNAIPKLTVDGIPNSTVGIIFSVGTPLTGQTRPAKNLAPAAITQYLESLIGSGNDIFVSTGPKDSFNDKLIVIKKTELFDLVHNRILRELIGDNTSGLKGYFNANSNYPYADVDGDGNADNSSLSGGPSFNGGVGNLQFNANTKSLLLNNGWFQLITYSVKANQKQVTLILGNRTLVIP